MEKHINIIALNIPFPANYGGVIDIYYKLYALSRCGFKIHLHCFEYGRQHAVELNNLCEEVIYYKREKGISSHFSLLPYNVYSRRDKQLLRNLCTNSYPILFEGLHSCYLISHPDLKDRMKIFRECNIEHAYYLHLGKAETNLITKAFFYLEALKFRMYEPVLRHADLMIAVSGTDTAYLRKRFPANRVEFIPCFHKNEQIDILPGQSYYILYHGNLSVPENERAALYLIENVFCRLPFRCVVAGLNPTNRLKQAAAKYNNVCLEINPAEDRMEELVKNAQVHVLVTFQETGLKLKLLNTLFAGRHVIANKKMLAGSGLDNLCCIANTADDLVLACNQYMEMPFHVASIEERIKMLIPQFSNLEQARRLAEMMG
ncbi:glycosyltransferase [Macellibacteroides fermentans]|uniref:glycosyltransferase n=1 Tax=Macellibacteroides fermentans TaxID=879969 RepID=UPI002CF8B183|nr:glycosyltransferase [Macellibacteroides fermentans]